MGLISCFLVKEGKVLKLKSHTQSLHSADNHKYKADIAFTSIWQVTYPLHSPGEMLYINLMQESLLFTESITCL